MLNGLELWGANKFISPNEDDFLLENTSYALDSYFPYGEQRTRYIKLGLSNRIEAQLEPPIESQKCISNRLNWIDQSIMLASSNGDTLPMERTTSTLNSSQVRIPNPKSLIQLHQIGSIPDAQDLEYLSDTRSTIFFRFQLFASSKWDSPLLAIITSSTASHALRSFITLSSTAFEWGVLNYNRANSVNQLKPHFLGKSKLESVSFVQKGSIILFSIIIIFNDFQTNANKEIKERFHVIQKNNAVREKWNQPTASAKRRIHKYTSYQVTHRNIRKTRQLPSISVHINKRTTTSLFTFNSN